MIYIIRDKIRILERVSGKENALERGRYWLSIVRRRIYVYPEGKAKYYIEIKGK